MLWNEATAFQLKRKITSVSLPDGAKIVSTISRIYNSGNSDGCDYEAISIIKYYGDAEELRSSYLKLIEDQYDEAPILGNNSDLRWGAKISGSSTEFYILPNTDHAGDYFVKATVFARDVSFDLRC